MDSRDESRSTYSVVLLSRLQLPCFHGISLSLRQLKIILKKLNLRRRRPVSRQLLDRTLAVIKVSFDYTLAQPYVPYIILPAYT